MLRKTARNAAAAVLLLVGIAGLFLPFLQGIATILLAIVVADFPLKGRILERYRHTRLGARLWERHERRLARDADHDRREAERKAAKAAARTYSA